MILVAKPFFVALFFTILAESDTATSFSNGIHLVTGINYGGTPGRRGGGGGCVDDNSGKGCCSNGQDFRGCFRACNGDARCENWCRSNCWDYWTTSPVGPGYWNGNGNGGRGNGGRGGYNPPYGGGNSLPPGRDPDWKYSDPCNLGSRRALDWSVVLILAGLVVVEVIV